MSGLIWAEPPAAPAARKSGPKPRSKATTRQAAPKPPQPVLCLLDGYPGSLYENREGNGITEGMKRKLQLLDRYPGRWALVGTELWKDGRRDIVGTQARSFAKYGYETATVNSRVYARRAHPDGLPIEAVVKKMPKRLYEPLPAVQPDSFGWSRAEINNALATARAWLFPTEGIQAA
jgi:hypothetical protein